MTLVTEAQRTEQAVTALIVLLLVVAALLTILTVWYWRHTSPKRRSRAVQPPLDLGDEELDLTGPSSRIYVPDAGDFPMEPQARNLR